MRGVPCEIDDVKLLAMRRAGKTYQDIALLEGVSVGTAWNAVRRARDEERKAAAVEREKAAARDSHVQLMPEYPIHHTPTAPCPHRGDVPKGTDGYCEQCSKSGRDYLPALHQSAYLRGVIEAARKIEAERFRRIRHKGRRPATRRERRELERAEAQA
jgi:hypothetical protein